MPQALTLYLSIRAPVSENAYIIIIVLHLRMQSEGYGAAIYILGFQARIVSASPRSLLLQCCEVLLFCRLVAQAYETADCIAYMFTALPRW